MASPEATGAQRNLLNVLRLMLGLTQVPASEYLAASYAGAMIGQLKRQVNEGEMVRCPSCEGRHENFEQARECYRSMKLSNKL
jgi:hypothetical protein